MLEEASRKTESKGADISDAVKDTSARVSDSFDKVGSTVQDYAKHTEETKRKIDMLAQTQKETDKTTLSLGDRLEKAGKSMKHFGQMAVDAGESIKKLTGGLDFWESFQGFAEAERSERGLNAMLKTNQRDVDETMEAYKEFADRIEDVTTTEGDLVIELLKQTEALDVTGASAKRAVRNAMALAEQTGRSAESFIKATAALEQGSAKAVSEYIPALRGIKDETEKSVEAQRILTNMYSLVGDRAETTAGKIEQLKNMWGNFKESVGEVISQALAPGATFLQELIREFKALPEWMQKGIAVTLTLVGVFGTLAVTVGTAVLAFTALGTAVGGVLTKTILLTTGALALKGALVAGVAYGAYQAGRAIGDMIPTLRDYTEELNKAREQSNKFSDKWADKFVENTKRVLKDTETITDRMARKQQLGMQLESARKEVDGYKVAIKHTQEQVDELNGRWNRWTGNKKIGRAHV